MKKSCLLTLLVLMSVLACFGQENNDFYDNTPEKALPGALRIEVLGEVASPGFIDLTSLPRRSLIVREARLEKGAIAFIGSYRYDGYSLFDILKEKIVAKKNQAEFRSIIDLLVAVENAKGDKVILSWGEIFYPSALHRILIADRVSPIIPSETKENWPLPDVMKLVCGNDLVSERNIDSPTRITVFSAPLSFPGKKGQKPLFAPNIPGGPPRPPARGVRPGRVVGRTPHLPRSILRTRQGLSRHPVFQRPSAQGRTEELLHTGQRHAAARLSGRGLHRRLSHRHELQRAVQPQRSGRVPAH